MPLEDKLEKKLTHVDQNNFPTMVDVNEKNITVRVATAIGEIYVGKEIMSHLSSGEIQTKKGPVFATAIVAGTMACKKTSELIPFCHPLLIEGCKITITPNNEKKSLQIEAEVKISGKTGVEMEALTAVTHTALTIYDMCKAINSEMEIKNIRLKMKTGGKKDFHLKDSKED